MSTEQTGWQHTSDLMARIAQLEASEANQHKWAKQFKGERNEARKRADELEAENARLREVLRPFASVGEGVAKMDLPDGLAILGGVGGRDVTVSDLKEAATILANHSVGANKMVTGGKEGA